MSSSAFLRFLAQLDWQHRKLAAQAIVGLPRLQRWIRAKGLRGTLAAAPGHATGPHIPADREALQRYGAVVNRVAGVRFIGATCLTRSVFLQRWLQARGVESALRIGVRSVEGTFAAHAWLEVDGEPINDTQWNVASFERIADLRLADPILFPVLKDG